MVCSGKEGGKTVDFCPESLDKEAMNSTRHLVVSLSLTFAIVVLGTFGYMAIEGWSLLDSLYMTIITLTTVGYSETRPLSDLGRLYTLAVIFIGFGFFVYVAGAVVQFMVEGQIRTVLGRRRLDQKINRLDNHYIVCGYGRIGGVLCQHLKNTSVGLVVIEKDPELLAELDADNMLYLFGDASDETLLLKAGIKRAKGLVAVLATDIDNVFLVLTARQLNPHLNIIARASSSQAKSKLRAAGANRVESPYEMGAANMAQRILRPTVTNFLDLAFTYKRKDIQMEEIPVSGASELVGVMLKDSGIRKNYNLILIAIKKRDGRMIFNPTYEATIHGGDTVIVVGEAANLKKLETILNPPKKPSRFRLK